MIIPIPIFMRSKSKDEITAEIEASNVKHARDLRIKLRDDIAIFKSRFRSQDIRSSPEAHMMYRLFGHTNVDKLTLNDLLSLGFNSKYITLRDIKKLI